MHLLTVLCTHQGQISKASKGNIEGSKGALNLTALEGGGENGRPEAKQASGQQVSWEQPRLRKLGFPPAVSWDPVPHSHAHRLESPAEHRFRNLYTLMS